MLVLEVSIDDDVVAITYTLSWLEILLLIHSNNVIVVVYTDEATVLVVIGVGGTMVVGGLPIVTTPASPLPIELVATTENT